MTVTDRRSARDWIVDVTCMSLAVLVGLLGAGEGYDTGRLTGAYLGSSLLLAGVCCGALWWRKRWPLGVALLILPISAYTELAGGAGIIALFTLAIRRRWQITVAVAALYVVAPVPYYVIKPDPAFTTFEVHGLNLALISVAVAWGMTVRARRELVASLRERAVRAEAEAGQRAERLRGLERERIAREMHDVLAHRISLVSLHAGALEIRPDLSPAQVAEAAGIIRASAHQALEDLREILGVLRAGDDGAAERPAPGLGNLAELVTEARSTGTPVSLDDRLPDLGSLPASVSRTAYRIVQEGLTNARKHAHGCEVRLRLDRTDGGELHVWLRNRLPGGPLPVAIPGSRSGLVGLGERVGLVGGRIDHGARRGEGGAIDFHLEAWVPWPI